MPVIRDRKFIKQFPTQGDLAREQLRRRGMPYFIDVLREIKVRLSHLEPKRKCAFAAACANRLMKRRAKELDQEYPQQSAYWKQVLEAVWESMISQTTTPTTIVKDA